MSQPIYTAQDWISRDDMATLARCSVDTITRTAKKHELETRVDETGRVLVNVGDYLALGKFRTETSPPRRHPGRVRRGAPWIRAQSAGTETSRNRSAWPGRTWAHRSTSSSTT